MPPIAESALVVPLESADAAQCARIGPKAANLAALAQAGLPTPGGFSLTADAYRAQLQALGLEDAVRRFTAAGMTEARRLSVDIRLALYEQPIADNIATPLLAAWRAPPLLVVCVSAFGGVAQAFIKA